MDSKSKKTYEPVFWSVSKEFNLTMAELCLVFLVKGLSKRRSYCYASKKTLAEMLNTTETTIYSLTKKLIKYGLLKKCGFSEYGTMCLSPTQKFFDYIQLLKNETF